MSRLGRGLLLTAACFAVACTSTKVPVKKVESRRPSTSAPEADKKNATPETSTNQASSNRPARTGARYGTGVFVTEPPASAGAVQSAASAAGGRDFQFRDAPIDLVLNQVLGEAFGLSYAMDPGVQGRLTVRLDGVADGASAIAALDGALRLQGIGITANGSSYLVSRTSASGPAGTGSFQILASPEDKVSAEAAVLSLRYANADDVVRLSKPLLPDNIVKLADASRGVIVLQGQAKDVAAAAGALRAFDVDWFGATSSALIPLQYASPGEIKQELDQLLSRSGGGVEVVALPRLGAVMIFARTRELLDRAQVILRDLDSVDQSAIQNNTLIYEAKYVSVTRLQAVASALFQLAPPPSSQPMQANGADPDRRAPPVLSGPPSNNSDVSIAVDEASNLIVIHGDQENLARIDDLFARIDRPQKQVLIEATIAEITLRDEFRFGIQWDGIADFLNVTFTDNSSGAVASKFPGISIVYDNVDIVSVLNALDTTSDVQIVSSPRVLALNNQPARIQVGDQVPIVTQSAVSVSDPGAPIVNATSYRDTGIILEVTPHVRAGDMVEIEISQEVSDVSQTVTSGIDSPTISTRRMSGVLAVPDGATVALGGLISSNRSKSNTGVPLLKDVPVLGAAFSSQADIVRRTELVVLLRPIILDSGQPELDISNSLKKALEKMRPLGVRQ